MDTTISQFTTIDEYIALYPTRVRELLQTMRKSIKEEIPDAIETISYQIPTFKLNGKNVVHFAAFKDHISFFPTSSPIAFFKEKLSIYKTSKGTIQFPLDRPLPLNLIKEIVRFRVKEENERNK